MPITNITYPATQDMDVFYQTLKDAITAINLLDGGDDGEVFKKTGTGFLEGEWSDVQADSGWIDAELTEYATSTLIQYRKIGNKVVFRGIVAFGVLFDESDPIFILPEGYRPSVDYYNFIRQANDLTPPYIDVNRIIGTNGEVKGVNSTYSLSAIQSFEGLYFFVD